MALPHYVAAFSNSTVFVCATRLQLYILGFFSVAYLKELYFYSSSAMVAAVTSKTLYLGITEEQAYKIHVHCVWLQKCDADILLLLKP